MIKTRFLIRVAKAVWLRCGAILGLIFRNIPDELEGGRVRYFLYRNYFYDSLSFFKISTGVVITGHKKIHIGPGSSIMSGSKLYAHDSDGISIGSYCSFNHNVTISSADNGLVSIGDSVLIGPNTVIVAADHIFVNRNELIQKQGHIGRQIKIEADVWIAANCVILGGVDIGYGSVVTAGAVVTKSIPSMQIWGGVPAKFIKDR